jgi:hypothetical protein
VGGKIRPAPLATSTGSLPPVLALGCGASKRLDPVNVSSAEDPRRVERRSGRNEIGTCWPDPVSSPACCGALPCRPAATHHQRCPAATDSATGRTLTKEDVSLPEAPSDTHDAYYAQVEYEY